LIIDDNSPARAVLSNMLTNMTFSADEAASGEEGIEMVRQAVERGEPYEIVFVDWQMPSLDGIETSKRILALPDLAISPHLVMVTAYGRDWGHFRRVKRFLQDKSSDQRREGTGARLCFGKTRLDPAGRYDARDGRI
jgi:CheY-like chemotaxis protein